MTINEIKQELGMEVLNLSHSTDADGNTTGWLRNWDNDNRVAITIHQETVDKIKADNVSTLGLQYDTKVSKTSNKEYTIKRIVAYNAVDIAESL